MAAVALACVNVALVRVQRHLSPKGPSPALYAEAEWPEDSYLGSKRR